MRIPSLHDLYRRLRRGVAVGSAVSLSAIAINDHAIQSIENDDVILHEADAPHWPTHKYNGHYTLHHGVWVDDVYAMRHGLPSRSKCLQIRREHLKTLQGSERISFTLVEGEQDAPMGKNGRMIRVIAKQNDHSSYVSDAHDRIVRYIPSVSVSPKDDDPDGWWATSMMGTLPMTLSVRRSVESAQDETAEKD